jgi:hypothetical protein
MNNLIVIIVACSLVVGCKKDKSASGGGGDPARGQLDAAATLDIAALQAQALQQALGIPDGGPEWKPGAMKSDVVLEGLGLTVDHPENLTVTVEGKTAKFTAPGFYPVTISIEKLTLENAVLKVDVNGVSQLSRGSTWDGSTNITQTDCDLIRCAVEKPEGWYQSEVAEAGEAICKSLEAPPPPTAPGLGATTSSNSTGGQCPEGTMERGQPFIDAVKGPELSAAMEQCWVEAVGSNPAWKDLEPSADIGLSNFGGPWKRELKIRDLEGDTAAFLTCLTAATATLDALLPTEALPEGCILTTMAYVKFGKKIVCP